jgi:hypothetical protein
MPNKSDVNEDAEMTRLRILVRRWKAEATRKGKPLRLPVMPFLLRNIWTGALLLFSLLTFSTFFITTVAQVRVNSRSSTIIIDRHTGDCHDQFGRYMLGSRLLGAVCDHHGGTVGFSTIYNEIILRPGLERTR